jgi:dihydropteroate synthase
MMKKKPFYIVGVLNITPDSFYDGGRYQNIKNVLKRAEEMIRQGADIIDVGGESTFLNRKEVSLEEELKRVVPVIKKIHQKHPGVLISIDTYKSQVARAAIAAGAFMVNDVTAGRGDKNMFKALAENPQTAYVLMYSKDATSRTTLKNKKYDDVIKTIKSFFKERIRKAKKDGLNPSRIILDPGLGYFVSGLAEYSYEIIARLPELKSLGHELYLSPSRKSFLAGSEKLPASDRLPATISVSALAVTRGATYIRTHDVAEVHRGCEAAIKIIGY